MHKLPEQHNIINYFNSLQEAMCTDSYKFLHNIIFTFCFWFGEFCLSDNNYSLCMYPLSLACMPDGGVGWVRSRPLALIWTDKGIKPSTYALRQALTTQIV